MHPGSARSNARVILLVASTILPERKIGQWVDAGEIVGLSPSLREDVRAPVSGVVTRITPIAGGSMILVVERRRDYEDMDD